MIDTMNTHVGSEEEEEEEEEEEGGGEEGGETEDGGEEGEGEREEVCVVGGEASSGQALLHVEIEANKTWVSFTIHNYCSSKRCGRTKHVMYDFTLSTLQTPWSIYNYK